MRSARRIGAVLAVAYLTLGLRGALGVLIAYALLAEAARIILAGVAAALPEPSPQLPVAEE